LRDKLSRRLSHLKYGTTLTLLGLAQIALPFTQDAHAFSWMLWWSGVSWTVAGCAYGGVGARAFGKRLNGNIAVPNIVLLFPFFAAIWLAWHLQRALSREPCYSEVASAVWLGRRCFANELPPEVGLIVDLTAEFPEPKPVREGRIYLCLPVLDASAPSLEDFQSLIQAIVSSHKPVYIHCAQGHGRSAMVAAAVLVARGDVATLDEAEGMLQSSRPAIKINGAQRKLLREWVSKRKE